MVLPIDDYPGLRLSTARLDLWMPEVAEAGAVLAHFRDNREHLGRWGPQPPPDFYTLPFWRRRLAANRRELAEDRSLRLAIAWRDRPGRVIGTISFTEIVRGAFQACYLGYGLAASEQGKGVMTEALREAIDYVFGELRLHRIMANYLPGNERSGAVLRRLGFRVDGYALDYLYINGAWRDHVLTSLANPDLPAPPPPLRL